MKLLEILGLTAETDLGFVDLVAVQRALKGERKIFLRKQEREFIYEQYGLTPQELDYRRRDPYNRLDHDRATPGRT